MSVSYKRRLPKCPTTVLVQTVRIKKQMDRVRPNIFLQQYLLGIKTCQLMVITIVQSPNPSTCVMSVAGHSLAPVHCSPTSAFTLEPNRTCASSVDAPSDSWVTYPVISLPTQRSSHTFASNATRPSTAPLTCTRTCALTLITSPSVAISAASGFTRKST